jgi:hypothetical protein
MKKYIRENKTGKFCIPDRQFDLGVLRVIYEERSKAY